jgi:small subunit ribosomal protein S16
MLMIRFQRIGRTNDPAFRIVLVEKERAAKTGRVTEQLGSYNPKTKALSLDGEKVKYWIGKGAQPTDSIHNLLIKEGVIEGKKINVLPKKTVAKKEEEAVVEAAPAAAEAPAAEPAPAEEVTPAEVAAPAEEAPAA